MVSLEKVVVQLRQKKQDATNLRKKAEKQLKEIRSVQRRSSSGLHSKDRKLESKREDVCATSDIITGTPANTASDATLYCVVFSSYSDVRIFPNIFHLTMIQRAAEIHSYYK